MTGSAALFRPFPLFGTELRNRIAMAPMTRGRIPPSGAPDSLTVDYYTQRASAGLIICEGTCPLPGGECSTGVPAIHGDDHVAGWAAVTRSVHEAGGHIAIQLWHAGRVSSMDWQPDGGAPLGPSAIRAAGARIRDRTGRAREPDMPREATRGEIQGLIDGFAHAALNAVAAGFDGVELHGANGYLLHQFFSDNANQRGDAYGGAPANRIRFAIEVAEAVTAAIGKARVGIRISPLSGYQAAKVSDPDRLYPLLTEELSRIGLAYVHCVEGEPGGARVTDPGDISGFDFVALRRAFDGAWIANNFYDWARAERAVARGNADMVSFGRPFIANPDLVARLRAGKPLAAINPDTLYAPGGLGYTDYPALDDADA